MTTKLRWETSDGGGVFALRSGELHLVWTEDGFDRLSRPAGGSGVSVTLSKDGSRLDLRASGMMEFESDGRRFKKVRLPLGRGVGFRLGEVRGSFRASGTPAVRDPLVGREIGGYQIRSRLGAGAVGVVYRALQTNLDREIALKILSPAAAKDPAMVASFRREAVAAGRLSHPNLVQVHDVGEEDGRHYFSMELVSEGSLEDRLREHGPLSWREAVDAVRECALALSFAEEHKLVHRDVKPENLMVAGSGHVKLADLGLAATRELMDREAAGGTPHFMAPEAISKHGFDHRADLYSLGCTLYRLLTGETPFQGDSVRAILRAHRDEPAPTLRETGVDAPRELDDLLASLLEKDPEKRPASAAEVVAECEALLRGRGSRKVAVLTGALLLIAGGLAVWQGFFVEPAQAEPEIVEIIRDSPEAARLEEQLAAQGPGIAFANALAAIDPEERLAALRSFLQVHGETSYAARARQEIQRIEEELAAPAEPVPRTPEEIAAANLRRTVDATLAREQFGAAMTLVDAASIVPAAERAALRDQVQVRLEMRAQKWESDHARALQAEDWETAGRVRSEMAAGLEGISERLAPWRTRLAALEEGAESARAAAAERRFAEARRALSDRLRDSITAQIAGFRFQEAAETYGSAWQRSAHRGLSSAAAAQQPLFDRAGRCWEAFLERAAASEEEVDFTEPREGRRARLLGVEPDGLLVQVQVQGERVERKDGWELLEDPAVLRDLLGSVLAGELREEEADSLALLIGINRVAARLRSWGATSPSAAQARQLAQEARSWARSLPFPLRQVPEDIAREQVALEAAASAAEALADGDPYEALLFLENLESRFTLLAAWASDGSSRWGLQP